MLETFMLAQAVPDTTVTVPWGQWIVDATKVLQPIATLALTGIASYVMGAYIPPWLKLLSGQAAQVRVNTVLEKAVASAIARVEGAVKGKESTIEVASEILRKAMQYAVDQAPSLIKSATSGKVENLQNMVLARMEEAGVTPAAEQKEQLKERVKDFDFNAAIKGHLGG